MGKSSSFLIGAIVGVAATAIVNYLFGPARDTEFNENYRSRLDWALEEGDKAAAAREAELRRRFEEAKRPRPRLADNESRDL